jgi:hypothetical protein
MGEGTAIAPMPGQLQQLTPQTPVTEQHWFKVPLCLPLPLQDDLLDVLYWLRQLNGIIFGLLWGFAAFTGFIGFMS